MGRYLEEGKVKGYELGRLFMDWAGTSGLGIYPDSDDHIHLETMAA